MTDQAPSTALATRPVREVRVVEDVIPVLDTARFEQMQRVATAIAQGSLIPETLRGIRKGETFEDFPTAVVVANVFRVVNQAVRWNADPFSVIDCCSVVHGRLMYEGKLVHAIVESRCGVRLNFRFGRMVDGKFDPSEEGVGEKLAIQVVGQFSDEDTERTIEGTVADWKTTGNKSPWGKAENYRRMLRYRGTREWARAHSPSVLLGVVTDDEMDEDVGRQERIASTRGPREKKDIRGALSAPKEGGGGFDADHVETETASQRAETEDQRLADPDEARQLALARAEGLEADAKAAVLAGADENPGLEALLEKAETEEEAAYIRRGYQAGLDELEARTTASGPQEASTEETDAEALEILRVNAYDDGYSGEPVEAALAECQNDAEEEVVRKAHAEGVAKRMEKDADPEPKPDAPVFEFNDVAGAAPSGETYLLASDEPGEDGKVPTYKDGKPFSRVGTKGAAALKRYDAHAEPETPKSDLEPDTRSPVYRDIASKDSWLQIKPMLTALYGDDDFKALTDDDQIAFRASIFPAVVEMKERTRDPVDWAGDVGAFVLFLDHTFIAAKPDAAEMIEGTLATLQGSVGWGKLNDVQKATIEGRVADRLARLRG